MSEKNSNDERDARGNNKKVMSRFGEIIVVEIFDEHTDGTLNRIRNTIRLFHHANECVNYIQKAKDEKIFLIGSKVFIEQIIVQIHQLPQLISIYIVDSTSLASSRDKKIKGVFPDIASVDQQIADDIRIVEENAIPISILRSNDDLDTLDPSFMYSQLLKEILFELPYDERERKRFIEFCRAENADNARELAIIQEFERDYRNHTPAWWYTRECFLYKMLNRALRLQSIDILWKIGFFMQDLHQQLEQLHATQTNIPCVLYRGQGMSVDEFKKLKKSVRGLLSFNTFLSTSVNRDTSLRFAQRSLYQDDLVAVLFEIHIDPVIRTIPFASLREISYYQAENEILFSLHSIFRIQEIEHMHNRVWNIKLNLTSDTDRQLQSLMNFLRTEIVGPNAIHRLASFMIKVKEWDRAKEIFELILNNNLPKTKNELSYIEHNLGWIYDEKNDLEQALIHYQKSIDLDRTYLPVDHPQFGPTYAHLALLHEKQGHFDRAMEYYRHALTIELKSPAPDQQKIASRYMNMGDLFRQLGRLQEAWKSVKTALNIRLRILPPTHPDLGLTYGHLFDISLSLEDYTSALEYAKESLCIKQKSLPANNFQLATGHNNVSAALNKLGRYDEALKEAREAVKIGQYTYPPGHPNMRIFENSLNALRCTCAILGS